ncbi:hypothetical protein TNIN_223191 [Trichonephila inaurata madagascariensis]|uniref:Uncharacterized protein n=1 Tax=Trichonephila inaurata madagascariensis TaxID=2747483 RepID=A0A8X6X3S0_9ARAC|nr:hypothetical protein TNIN_223191 [Trichonephila inaurata madagascariensis]
MDNLHEFLVERNKIIQGEERGKQQSTTNTYYYTPLKGTYYGGHCSWPAQLLKLVTYHPVTTNVKTFKTNGRIPPEAGSISLKVMEKRIENASKISKQNRVIVKNNRLPSLLAVEYYCVAIWSDTRPELFQGAEKGRAEG